MESLLGFGVLILILWWLFSFIIAAIRGQKAVFRKSADSKLVDQAAKPDLSYVFQKNIYKEMVQPVLWIVIFTSLFVASTDIATAILGTVLLTWFMYFKLYYIIISRKDQVIVSGQEISFVFRTGSIATYKLREFTELNLEFRRSVSRSNNYVFPYLIFGEGLPNQEEMTNAALMKYPNETIEAIHRLNPSLKIIKTWNDTVKKKKESIPAVFA